MPDEQLTLARSQHDSGLFPDAIRTCRDILQREPGNREALHLCGRALLDDGCPAEALPLLKQAVEKNPDSVTWLLDLGLALQADSQPAEAATAFRHALAVRPDNPDGWCRLAASLRKMHDRRGAAEAYRRALSFDATSKEASFGLATALLAEERWEEAAAQFRQALQLDPRWADPHNGLGLALKGAHRPKEAAAEFRQALALRPRYIEALVNLGNTLQTLELWSEAADSFRQALALVPDSPELLGNLGNALWGARDHEGALAAHQEAIRLAPSNPAAYNNLGNTLLALRRFKQATASFELALRLQPDNVHALCHLGNVHLAQNQLDRALDFYNQALHIKPDFKLAVFNRSLVLLLQGDFKAGLPGYELRWVLKQQIDSGEIPGGRWGSDIPLEGKTILVCGEQGLGDTIQFVRYVPLLQARGAKVVLRVQSALADLISASMPDAVVTTSGEPALPPFDYYSLMLSLPLAFVTEVGTIPANVPYLASLPEKTARWRERLAATPCRKIGLVCSGNVSHRNDHNRSLPLAAFEPLARMIGTQFYLIQKELRPGDGPALAASPNIVSLAGEIHDFTDTAGIIANLDLVIAADTSVAHLAGAMGKPVWTLLPFAPDWRWLMDRTDSPWYPTMRLFRQKTPGDWTSVIAEVAAALAALPTTTHQPATPQIGANAICHASAS